ncbi:hypothetical protein, partial [Helicobacter sp. WB40]|uniref:hypothetical protein n=1 Tax=Helicobacter sp. WB40 TaxID=3004130 RepID=UPI0022EBB1F5
QITYKQKQNQEKTLLAETKVLQQEIDLLRTLKSTLERPLIEARIYLLEERLKSFKLELGNEH